MSDINLKPLRYGIPFFALMVLAIFTGCTHTAVTNSEAEPRSNDAVAKVLKENETEDTHSEKPKAKAEKTSQSAAEIENLTIDEVIRIEEPNTQNLYDNSRYDFPITMNSRVEGWIDYFTGRGREHMERYLSRSSRYIPVMKRIFKKAGLPEDLVFLALIESGFNLRAKSRARAVGPWQFMKGTGKRYGLRVDAWVDERRDPIRSTEAAANYLKDLYLMFESWYLAASAYNAGEYKILRTIEDLKTNNFWRICQTKKLRRETKDYIPKLIAAAIIGKNPARYGFKDVSYQEPLEFDTVSLDYPVHLREIAKVVDVPEDDLSDLNPGFTRGMVPPSGGTYEVRVPVGTKILVQRALASFRGKGDVNDLPLQHTVKAGETLASLAKRYHVRTRDLANTNNLSPRESLPVGSLIIVPHKGEAEIQVVSHSPKAKQRSIASFTKTDDDKAIFITHVVKSGESLWSIAEQYNVTVQNIFRWNGLRRSSIHPGKQLRIKSPKNQSS